MNGDKRKIPDIEFKGTFHCGIRFWNSGDSHIYKIFANIFLCPKQIELDYHRKEKRHITKNIMHAVVSNT